MIEEAIAKGEKGRVSINDTVFEDNFCNGVHISSLYLPNNKRRLKSMKKDLFELDIMNCKFLSNKNIGLSVHCSSIKMNLEGSQFKNNLYCDLDLPVGIIEDKIKMEEIVTKNDIEQDEFIQ
jgi:hypothetical protein